MATYSITDYGAVSGGDADTNRIAFNAAHTACAASGDEIFVPNGYYELARLSGSYAVAITKSVTLRGESRSGAILAQPADDALTAITIRLINMTGPNITVRDLTFEGNKPNSNTVTAYDPEVEHHAAFFTDGVLGITIDNVAIRNFTGDGIQFYSGTTDILLENSILEYCQRDGISFTPGVPEEPVLRAVIRNNIFRFISVQPVDNEHGPARDVEIYGNIIDPGLNAYAITVSGYSDTLSSNTRSQRWHIYDNELHGGVYCIRCDDILIEDNYGINTSRKPSVDVARSSTNITVRNNVFHLSQTESASVPAVRAIGTQSDVQGEPSAFPDNIVVQNNRLSTSLGTSWGVQFHAVANGSITGNAMLGPGIAAAGYAGVLIRSTLVDREMQSITVIGNWIRDWGEYGVRVQGTSTSKIQYVRISNNTIENTIVPAVMDTGVNLNDGTGALLSGLVAKNLFGTGVTSTIINIPPAPANISLTLGGVVASGFGSTFGRKF